MRRVVVYPDGQSVADAVAARFFTTVADALATQDQVHVVVTGGSLGIASLEAIAASPLASSINWTAVHLWWGDERFVDAGHADRNEGQAQQALLRHVPIPEENIHRMGSASSHVNCAVAAAAYHDEIDHHGKPEWDVLMLGLGPDGHVASLFPAHPGFTGIGPSVIAITDSPKPPPERVSLSLAEINRAKEVWVMAAGASKADAVALCLSGNVAFPGAVAHGTERTMWLIDAQAAARA